jgi:hypothetical protein
MRIDRRESSPTLLAALVREFPFLRLTWHFVQSLFRNGQNEGDLDASVGGLLGLLALPGVFMALSLLDKYSSLKRYFHGTAAQDHYAISVPDKYFFIVFSMVITGLVTVWKWDRILPNRQDHMNLAPLPITARRIFFANLSAILVVIAVFAVVVNLGSTILFPMIASAEHGRLGESLVFIAVHATVVTTASVFTFFACLLVLGLMLAALPPLWFLRASIPVRMAIVAVLVALLGSSFTVPLWLRGTPPGWLAALPPVWFLAWYQKMQGRATPQLEEWARWALPATAIVFVLAMIAYLVSYRRSFVRIPESAGVARRGERERWPWLVALLERFVWRTPFERATGVFLLRGLLRSETHLILTTAFVAMGLVSVAQAAVSATGEPPGVIAPSQGWLSLPLILAYFLVTGARLVVDIPAAIEANWILRFVLPPGNHSSATVVRKLVLSLVAIFVSMPTLALVAWRWNFVSGIVHATFVFGASALLLELLLLGYRKIPFTCSLPPFERSGPLVFLAFWLGFAIFTWGGSTAQRAMLLHPVRYVWLALFAGGALYALREWKRDIPDVDRELIFHDTGTKAYERLELSA